MARIPVAIWVRFARLSSSLRLPLSVKACRRWLSSSPARGPDLVDRYQHRSAFLLNQKHYEFRRFGLARVSADDVNTALWRCTGSEAPGGYSTASISPSLPGTSGRSLEKSVGVRHSSTNANFGIVIGNLSTF